METESKPSWLQELLSEVRRAGRAAVSARAAAEACEESVERLADREAAEAATGAEPAGDDGAILRALLPVFDALDRIAADTRRSALRTSSWLERLRRPSRHERELKALREAVLLLQTQLHGALESCGVEIDRDLDVDVDPARHRVVELREPGSERSGAVVEIVRPGYRHGGRRIRDADVVATR